MATMIEVLNRIRQPVPRSMLMAKSKGGTKLVFVPWYRAVELMDERAPGWSYEVREVGELAGKVFLVVRVTIQCDDGVIFREATGNEAEDLDTYGDPFSNAEGMALRRALAKFGLALYVYDKDRRGTIQERGYPALLAGPGHAPMIEVLPKAN